MMMKLLGLVSICLVVTFLSMGFIAPVKAGDGNIEVLVLAGDQMPDLTGYNVGDVGKITDCTDVAKVMLEKPGNSDKAYWDAVAWFLSPDAEHPFLVVLFDSDSGDATDYYVDLDRDGEADRHVTKLYDLDLPNNVCEIAKEVE